MLATTTYIYVYVYYMYMMYTILSFIDRWPEAVEEGQQVDEKYE